MPLEATLDKLAAFEPTQLPVISLYLNTQPDQHGSANFDSFVRKELKAKAQTFALRSSARLSFDKDAERITAYLETIRPSANGVAIFACAGENDFFEGLELDAPIDNHRLYVYHQPHLYPLARVHNRYPRYAALIADTNAARIYVFGIGERLDKEQVKNRNVNKTRLGGWSQARYQRHIENYYLHHAKEVVETLDKVVTDDNINHVVLAGDEVILPVLREQFPSRLQNKIIDTLRLDITTPEHEVARETLEALHAADARTDEEKVNAMLDEYRADNLAVVGAHDTLAALRNGQVDELIICAALENIHDGGEALGAQLLPDLAQRRETSPAAVRARSAAEQPNNVNSVVVKVADELITRARQTGAGIRFIENAELLAEVGGVGATLRYKL